MIFTTLDKLRGLDNSSSLVSQNSIGIFGVFSRQISIFIVQFESYWVEKLLFIIRRQRYRVRLLLPLTLHPGSGERGETGDGKIARVFVLLYFGQGDKNHVVRVFCVYLDFCPT